MGPSLAAIFSMKRWLALPSVQIALCVGAYLLVGYHFGVFAVVFTAPVFAVAIRHPVFALLANFRSNVRKQVWLPLHGQHYVFHNVTIHVIEDDDHYRWVSLPDVQKAVGVTAAERALAQVYPGRVKTMGNPAQAYVRDDALVSHLGKENLATALRFRTWLERNVAFPGRTIRKRLGIHADHE